MKIRLTLLLCILMMTGALASGEEQPAVESMSLAEALAFHQSEMAAGRLYASLAGAERVLQLVNEDSERFSETSRINAVRNAADVASALQLYDREIPLRRQIITLLGQRDGSFSNSLYEHMVALGRGLLATNSMQEAEEVLERALLINRQTEGLYSLSQQEAMIPLSEIMLLKGNHARAIHLRGQILSLFEHKHGPLDVEILPGLLQLADWHRNFSGGEAFELPIRQRVVNIAADAWGDDDPRTIQAYWALAATYRSGRLFSSAALKLLRNAVQVLDEALPESLIARAEARIHLADWYVVFNRGALAQENYGEASKLISQMEDSEELLEQLFGQPKRLTNVPFLPPSPVEVQFRDNDDVRRGSVLIGYSVTAEGKTADLTVLEADPENTPMGSRVITALRDYRYRPAIIAGVPVDAQAQQYRHAFYYRDRSAKSDS